MSTVQLVVGGSVMLFSLLVSTRLVDNHFPDVSEDQRMRLIVLYRSVFGAWAIALGLGWAVPTLGAAPFVIVFTLTVIAASLVLLGVTRSRKG